MFIRKQVLAFIHFAILIVKKKKKKLLIFQRSAFEHMLCVRVYVGVQGLIPENMEKTV